MVTKKETKRRRIPLHHVSVPEYHVRKKPDHHAIGKKIDIIIKKHFMGQRVAIRCLGSREHPNKTVQQLINTIRKTGTDRYDPHRKGDRYENVQKKHIDFFALDFLIRPRGAYTHLFIEPFYYWPKKARGYPVRIDLMLIYDLKKLKRVVHQYHGRKDTKRDGFVFRDHDDKTSALKALIHVR